MTLPLVRSRLHFSISSARLQSSTFPARQHLHSSPIMSTANTAAALYAAVSVPLVAASSPKEAEDVQHHGKNGRFVNPWPSWHEQTAPQIISAMAWRSLSGKANKPDTTPPTVPIRKPEFLPSRDTEHLRATWLGHACYYVEFPGGLRVLFDPVFTDRCSPMSFLGPKRYTPPPCDIADIPIIDLIVISHNHYDHLSLPTIQEIHKKHPNAHFFAPLGNKAWFTSCGISNMTELDWWQSRSVTLSPKLESKVDVSSAPEASDKGSAPVSATVGCLPCQHMAARSAFDRAKTLWSSWSIESGGKKIWFGGDTGYRSVPQVPEGEDDYSDKYASLPHCPAFKQIGQHRGPFDLGLIPIGAYMPRFIMSPMHANPFDSVNIFKDTGCKRAMGIHWGTWVLTEEEVLEPPRLLKEALKKSSLPEDGVFDVCDIGESREFPGDGSSAPKL